MVLGVVCFATIGEVTGSLLWGVYRYRLHNLPLFVPPAHGLVYLTGIAIAAALAPHARAVVITAAAAAATWGVLGLFVLPRRDVAGAVGIPLLLLFLWRSRNRAVYASVFLVVAALELYGTAIGTWRWAPRAAGARDSRRQPAVRRRLGLRVVRRDGADSPRRSSSGAAQNSVDASRAAPTCSRPSSVTTRPRGRALQEAELEQIGLVDVLDRLGLLAERDGERREPDRAAAELHRRPRASSVAVEPLEPGLVDLEQLERLVGDRDRDHARVAHLGDVADAAQDAVRDPRRAARAPGDLVGGVGLDLDAEDPRAAPDDRAELLGRVVVEPEREPEAVAQRRRQQAGARGRADERERRQVERQRARRRPLADDDVEPEVLERRVEDLLDRRGSAGGSRRRRGRRAARAR